MATLYNSDLKPLESGTYTHYYDHATKLFLADNLRLAPKQSFLYYVCINVDVSALQSILGVFGSESTSSQSLIEQYETGLLAKKVELPRFNTNTKTFNAYNRKNIVQTNLRYDPLNITFHDDAADTVTRFWNDFYTYYYRDSDYNPSRYTLPHKYQPRSEFGWGFSPRNGNLKPFLRNIQLFSLHNKRFTEYLLINPIITAWRHGEHNSSDSNGMMEANMTVEFETVKYRTGYVNPVDVNGFATIHYDNTPSPISNSITNIYTDSGLLGAITEGADDLSRPDGTGSGSGLLGSILNAYRFYNNIKNVNFPSLGSITLGQVGAQVLGGVINGAAQNVFFPTLGSSPGYGTTYAGSSTLSQPNSVVPGSSYGAPLPSSSAALNNQAIGIVVGATASFSSSNTNDFTRGVETTASRPASPLSTANYPVRSVDDTIVLDPRSAQPATQETYTYVSNAETGETISRSQSVGSQVGGYDPTNPNKNAKSILNSIDQNGRKLKRTEYTNGDIVTFNEDGSVYSTSRGFQSQTRNFNTAPPNTRDQAASGQRINPAGVQYYTNPNTGITEIISGDVSGIFQDRILNTNNITSDDIIGKILGTGSGGQPGPGFGTGKNNLLKPSRSPIFGMPTQVFDPNSGTILNTGDALTGTGAYSSQYPSRNIKSYVDNGDGTITVQTFDGGSANVNVEDNSIISINPGTYTGLTSWLGPVGVNQDDSINLPLPGTGSYTTAWGSPYTNAYQAVPQYLTSQNELYSSVIDNFSALGQGASYDSTFLSPSTGNSNNWSGVE